jgi:ferredoxin
VNLFNVADRFAGLDHSAVILDAERCQHKLYRFSDCEACFNICPASAITPGKPPGLNVEKCQSCLACLTVCPVGAYTADDAVAPLLNAVTHLEGSTLELLCEKNPRAELGFSGTGTGICVRGCLAGLGTGAYLALAVFGLEHIQVRTDACSSCDWQTLPNQVETQVNQARQLLEVWGKEETINCISGLDAPVERPVWKATNPPLSRRDLFRMLARQGQIAIARSIEDGQPHSGHRPGRNHRRIVGAVAHLPVPDLTESIVFGELGFACLSVSEACTACGVCARACPTSAIKFIQNEKETTFTLALSVRNCIGCEICIHVCFASALSVDHTPTFSKVFGKELEILQEGGLVKCEQCGILFAARADIRLCTLCDYRRTHPFGSTPLPGFKELKPQRRIDEPNGHKMLE